MKTLILNLRSLRRIWHPSRSYARTIEVAARNESGALRIQRWGWTRFVVAIKNRQRATKPNTPSRRA